MITAFRPRTLVLFVGDLLAFVVALWGSLFLRVFELPSGDFFVAHLTPFSLLFVAWVAVFFIAGLYENRSLILARRALSTTLLIAQTFNMVIAALFFFFVPLFGIAPKTLLFIYLVVSFLLILLWRVVVFPLLRHSEPAIVVGQSSEITELVQAIRNAHRAPITIAEVVPVSDSLAEQVVDAMERNRASILLADFNDPIVSKTFSRAYTLLSVGVRFFDATAVYEEVFGRIPLSTLDDRWVVRNVSRSAHVLYDPIKRLMDITVGSIAGLLSLVVYPFLLLAIRFQDNGPVFITQQRVGQDGAHISLPKFRSMQRNEQNLLAKQSDNQVTPVGKVIRLMRIDELPQLWSVVRGDLSLIGPRPELPSGVDLYSKEIPYYQLRHLVRPGLSGWAQLYHDNHPHHGAEVEATREKLSYDLYYLKHRSLILDFTIALKTIKKLLTRSGV